jgi:hypothetical protein
MSPQELQMLDKVISPEVARILIKLLPELGAMIQEIEKMNMGSEEMQRSQMGALGNM